MSFGMLKCASVSCLLSISQLCLHLCWFQYQAVSVHVVEDPCLQLPSFEPQEKAASTPLEFQKSLGLPLISPAGAVFFSLETFQSDVTCGLRGLKLHRQGREERLGIYQPSVLWQAFYIFSW